MRYASRPLANVLRLSEPTPISDELEDIVGSESLATWNRYRGSGGEWDTLKMTPLKVRKKLTAARYLTRGGMLPDEFCDLLCLQGGSKVGRDPIAWYLRTSLAALEETERARRKAREAALARSSGAESLFEHRNRIAREAGFRSYFDYRIQCGWGDGHGRRAH